MTKPAVYTSRRQWALEVLGIDEEADSQAVRRGIQQRLDECNLVPPPPWREAIDILTRGVTKTTWFERAYESRLRERIGDFSGRLWSLPMDQRVKEFHELTDLAQDYPALVFRMQELSEANEYGRETSTIEDPKVRELAELGRQSLVLVPGDRSAHWATWAAKRAKEDVGERWEWEEAASRLQGRHANLYVLARERFKVLREGTLTAGIRRHTGSRYLGPLFMFAVVFLILWFLGRQGKGPDASKLAPPVSNSSSEPGPSARKLKENQRKLQAARQRYEAALKAAQERKRERVKSEKPDDSSADRNTPTTKFMIGPNGIAKRLPDGTWAPATEDELPKGVLPEPPVKDKDDGGAP